MSDQSKPEDSKEGGGQGGSGKDASARGPRSLRTIAIWIGAATAIVVAATTFFTEAIGLKAAYTSFMGRCDRISVDVQSYDRIPYSLKSTISHWHSLNRTRIRQTPSERRSGEGQGFLSALVNQIRDFFDPEEARLYWFLLEADNRCLTQKHFIHVKLEIPPEYQKHAVICNEKSEMMVTVDPWDSERVHIDPDFFFKNPGEETPLRVNWTIYPPRQDDFERPDTTAPLKSDHETLMVLPRREFVWDWNITEGEGADAQEKKPVPKEFVVASLTTWASDSHPRVTKLSEEITSYVDPVASRREAARWTSTWIRTAIAKIEEGPYRHRIRLADTRPLMRDRTREIAWPGEVLARSLDEDQWVDPAEMGLLIAALARKRFDNYNLTILRAPKRRFFLAWSVNDEDWLAIDLTKLQSPFDENLRSSSEFVNRRLSEAPDARVDLLASDGDGVHFEGTEGLVALNVKRAIDYYDIDTNPGQSSCDQPPQRRGLGNLEKLFGAEFRNLRD